MAKKRMRKKDRRFITICLFIIGLCLCGIGYYYLTNNEEVLDKIIPDIVEKKKLTIVDEDSKRIIIEIKCWLRGKLYEKISFFNTYCKNIFIKKPNKDCYFRILANGIGDFEVQFSYNDKKSSIYITNIKYCGNKETGEYEEIECVLYESYDNIEKKISSYSYKEKKKITLDDFLETVTLYVDNYKKTCKEYSKNSLYLLINAKENNNKIITYKVPLILEKNCPN